MSTTSKPPRRVALAALRVGMEALPRYASKYSRKDLTQPQLFACLILKRFFKADYHGIVAYLHDMPGICQAMGLTKVPHHTTLEKTHKRLLRRAKVRRLLNASVEQAMGRKKTVRRAAACPWRSCRTCCAGRALKCVLQMDVLRGLPRRLQPNGGRSPMSRRRRLSFMCGSPVARRCTAMPTISPAW